MNAAKPDFSVEMIDVNGQLLQVAYKSGSKKRPPILLFNGIGASWETAKPFLEALRNTEAIIFDIPGVGGSPAPRFPYRPSTIARLGKHLIAKLGYDRVDVAGVSWGGGMAQQFARQYPAACRKLVLAATSPGAIMVPGRLSVLWKMVTPRRYLDKVYMREIAPELYGGDLRQNVELVASLAGTGPKNLGYFYQLLAMAGWTSLPWLWSVRQPTMVLAGRDDPIVPLVNGRILAHLLPNARLKVIENGHLFILTRPAEVALLVEEFLDE